MLDLSQFQTVGGLAVFLMLFLTFTKRYLPPKRLVLVPYLAIILGVVFAVLIAWATDHLLTRYDVVSYVFGGLVAGFWAIGIHETTLDKLLRLLSPPDPVQAVPPDPTSPAPTNN
jgi:hypothetical protein